MDGGSHCAGLFDMEVDDMTNHEAIKGMSVEEMAFVFYMMMKPFIEAMGASEEDGKAIRDNLRAFLQSDVTGKK